MKSFFAFAALSMLSLSAFARDYKLTCVAAHNADLVVQKDIILGASQKEISFGKYEGFEFVIANKGNNIVELQTINIYEPSRTYATATLNAVGSVVQLSIWNRNFLLESRCTVKN